MNEMWKRKIGAALAGLIFGGIVVGCEGTGPDEVEATAALAIQTTATARPTVDTACQPTGPLVGQLYLYEHANFSGGCWRVIGGPTNVWEIDYVGFFGIPNDSITKAILGPNTYAAFFKHAQWGGQNVVADNYGVNVPVVFDIGQNGFNDELSSLRFAMSPTPRPVPSAPPPSGRGRVTVVADRPASSTICPSGSFTIDGGSAITVPGGSNGGIPLGCRWSGGWPSIPAGPRQVCATVSNGTRCGTVNVVSDDSVLINL